MTFLAGFSKRKAIKIATAGIPSSSLTAFMKRFLIAGDTDIGGETTSQKLAVTLADGVTQVPYGARYFNVSGGAATLDISAKFDLSSSLSNGDIIGYLYYDHTATDQSNKSGVLDSNTVGYWPLEESAGGPFSDWSSNANNLSAGVNFVSDGGASVAGQVSNGLSLPDNFSDIYLSDNASIKAAGNVVGTSGFTISGLVQRPSSGNTPQQLWSGKSGSDGWAVGLTAANKIEIITGSLLTQSCLSTTVLSASTWYHIAAYIAPAAGGGTCKLYINGSSESTGAAAAYSSSAFRLAYGSDTRFAFHGLTDEVNLADAVERAAAWIAAESTDQFSNSSTFTLGSEETSGGAASPTAQTDWPNPAARLTAVTNRTWTEPTKIILAGKDRFFGADGQAPENRDWPVPAGRLPAVALKTIANNGIVYLGQDTIYSAPGQAPAYDWPVPQRRAAAVQQQQANLLAGPLVIYVSPFHQTDWSVPRGRVAARQSWEQNLVTTTLAPPSAAPFAYYDWPVAKGQPARYPPIPDNLLTTTLFVAPPTITTKPGPVVQGYYIAEIVQGFWPRKL